MPEYIQPILAGYYKWAGWIIAISGIIGALFLASREMPLSVTVSAVLLSIFSGMVTYGVGQVIDLIGKTAFFSEMSHTLLANQFELVNRLLVDIESEVSSQSEPLKGDLAEIGKDLKGLRSELETMHTGPVSQLNWMPHLAAKNENQMYQESTTDPLNQELTTNPGL